jgi:hypothetical protein
VGTTSAEDLGNSRGKVVVFPNPVLDILTVQINTALNPVAPVILTLYNLTGQTVLRKELPTTQESIDVSRIITGNYYVRIEQDGRLLTAKTLIISR